MNDNHFRVIVLAAASKTFIGISPKTSQVVDPGTSMGDTWIDTQGDFCITVRFEAWVPTKTGGVEVVSMRGAFSRHDDILWLDDYAVKKALLAALF